MRWRGTRRSGALRLSVLAAIYLKKEDDEPIHAIPSGAPGRLAGALGQAGALCSGGGADCRGGYFWLEILATTPNGARIATELENRFGRTPYAQMGALAAAKALYQAANAQAAKVQLQWAADVAIDVEYRQIARLRLSALLLEEKAYDEALRVLNSGASTPAFAALRAQQRGDALAAQGQREQARAAYRDALQSLDAKNTAARQWVQLKLNALGG